MAKYTIYRDTIASEYLYFENDKTGEDDCGGMWFNNKELYDYDGCFEIPMKVIEQLESEGYNMDYARDGTEE